MDKRILDVLIKFGLVTNTCVDPEKYADVDDLINKGVVTIPGAKSKIMELIEKANIEATVVTEDVKTTLPETVVEVKEDEIVEVTEVTEVTETEAPVEEVAETVEVPVEETPVEEIVTEEVPTEEVAETTEEVTEEAPKKKKSTKKAE
jgi:hypothetical protein